MNDATSPGRSDGHTRAEIARELKRLEESAKWSSQGQFEQSKQWGAVNLVLGIPVSVLAAISGATALASVAGRIVAGVLALMAAGLGAVLTTLNAGHRANRASAAANGYLSIQTAARQARNVDVPGMPLEAARECLADLTARLDEQNHSAAPVNRRAYDRASKNIESGGQTYAADAEG